MGLFINSHLQSLSLHKKLTELEKLSEVTTGILALKAMVEGGHDLSKHKFALDNLARMLPMLSAHQQKFVIDEIITPLMEEQDELSSQDLITPDHLDDESEVADISRGATSDYEMEFQIKLNRRGKLDVKELNRTQRDKRYQQELKHHEEKTRALKQELLGRSQVRLAPKVDEFWARIEKSSGAKQKRELRAFLYAFTTGLSAEHPKIIEARERLEKL